MKSPLATLVPRTTRSRSPCFAHTWPWRRVSNCIDRAWVLSSIALLPAATTASASTVKWSASRAALPADARLTVPCAVSVTSPRSALLMVCTVRFASTRALPAVVARVVRLMSLRSLLPRASTLEATSAPVLSTVIAPSAASSAFRFSAPWLASTMSPAPVSASEAVATSDFSTIALSAVALSVAALTRPSLVTVVFTPPAPVTVNCPACCRMPPSAARSRTSLVASRAVSAVPMREITPPSSPARSSISARPVTAVTPLTSMTLPAVVRTSPSWLLPAPPSKPALTHTDWLAITRAVIALAASTSSVMSAPARRLTVSVL